MGIHVYNTNFRQNVWLKQIRPNLSKGYSQTYICADYVWNKEKKYMRQTDRQTLSQRDRDRETKRDRQTDVESERQRQTDRQTDRRWVRETETDRHTDTQRQTDRQTDVESERQTERQTERQRQRDRKTETERDRQRQRQKQSFIFNLQSTAHVIEQWRTRSRVKTCYAYMNFFILFIDIYIFPILSIRSEILLQLGSQLCVVPSNLS